MASETIEVLSNSELERQDLIGPLADLMLKKGWMLTTAESCTGGLISAACTDLAGSSAWFERGFVTYSNAAKTEQLGVLDALIAEHGAVSQQVARAMALGALAHSRAQLAVSVTGVAGPGGGSAAKPVGTVWFGYAFAAPNTPPQAWTEQQSFPGDRASVRQATVRHALAALLAFLQTTN
jgi:nicotinamide-nucleotide amidase